ncbi:phenylalanyl-tRNA synthetase alpha subunit [Heliothis virescens ascovirus 3e]|uniref:Phenylalanyl-tRNA synthetase alpha subunit n=2 Tax=Ascovirus hvav3a TaxID=3444724 RepID=A4KXD0_HVAVE|nr:phenylalanyl-tRNA synthetase alpha subunit [Heliothis virescens ascovirus 3e]YP_009702075.1 phenylalanyl-tRNA synthetase alpha subunit [Heliothis virescens ascovirus 3g]ABO37261.1 phenylalanyl-tRNA synthetase alpha subunit [Heliothis virescens ascovirus 3e]AFV50334.1 phenylalanyl-tRNA synthetase alpha subunit [Heliothis virescens ascovirus 3g]
MDQVQNEYVDGIDEQDADEEEAYIGRQDYEDDDYNFRDQPMAGAVVETTGDWREKYESCLRELQPPYSNYFEESVKPEAFVSNIHYKQFRNPGSMVLGYCLFLTARRRPNVRLSSLLTSIVSSHSGMIHDKRVTTSSILREFEYFKMISSTTRRA